MTKIERLNPEIGKLAKELGLKVYHRGGAYWAGGDLQLTYQMETVNGKSIKVDEKRNLEIAEQMLRKLKALHDEQKSKSVENRVDDVLNGMKEIIIKRNNFCTWGYESLDHGTLFQGFGNLNGYLRIKGFDEIRVDDSSLSQSELIDQLKEKFFERYLNKLSVKE